MNRTDTDLNDVAAFVEIVRAEGLSPAAMRTGMPRSTLSRALKRLEGALGVTLARRSPKAFSLTHEGRRYFAEVSGAVERLRGSHHAVGTHAAEATVRASVPLLISHFFMPPALASFRKSFPSTPVRLRVEEERVDMEANGLDLVIRVGDPGGEAKVGRELFRAHRRVYASPGYVERRGAPEGPEQIVDHDVLTCVPLPRIDEAVSWTLDGPSGPAEVDLRPILAINDPEAVLSLACRGMGLCLLPQFVALPALRSGDLVRVLPNWQEPGRPVRVLYADGRRAAEPVRGLAKEIADHAPDVLGD